MKSHEQGPRASGTGQEVRCSVVASSTAAGAGKQAMVAPLGPEGAVGAARGSGGAAEGKVAMRCPAPRHPPEEKSGPRARPCGVRGLGLGPACRRCCGGAASQLGASRRSETRRRSSAMRAAAVGPSRGRRCMSPTRRSTSLCSATAAAARDSWRRDERVEGGPPSALVAAGAGAGLVRAGAGSGSGAPAGSLAG